MIVVFFIFRIDCSSCSISSGMYYSKGSSKAYHQCCNKAGNTVSQSVIQSVGSPWRAVMKCVTLFIYLFERGMPKTSYPEYQFGGFKSSVSRTRTGRKDISQTKQGTFPL